MLILFSTIPFVAFLGFLVVRGVTHMSTVQPQRSMTVEAPSLPEVKPIETPIVIELHAE